MTSILPVPLAPVVVGQCPEGDWVPYAHGLYGYVCLGDGNCFWRAAAVQVYGDQNAYDRVRTTLVSYVDAHPALTVEGLPLELIVQASGFDSVQAWREDTLTDGVFGGFLEAALLAMCFECCVEVYTGVVPQRPCQHIFYPHGTYALRFHFHNNHYNALFYQVPESLA